MIHRWEYGAGEEQLDTVQLKEQWPVEKALAAQEAKTKPESQRKDWRA